MDTYRVSVSVYTIGVYVSGLQNLFIGFIAPIIRFM